MEVSGEGKGEEGGKGVRGVREGRGRGKGQGGKGRGRGKEEGGGRCEGEGRSIDEVCVDFQGYTYIHVHTCTSMSEVVLSNCQ